MSDIVYVFGAGVNKAIEFHDLHQEIVLEPPLLRDLFIITSQMPQFQSKYFDESLAPVYNYIKTYWGLDKSDLAKMPFNIEDCFTRLEEHLNKAVTDNNIDEASKIYLVEWKLKSLLAEVLKTFEQYIHYSDSIQFLGKILYSERPTIITFNYDCYVESIIEFASGLNPNHPIRNIGRNLLSREVNDEDLIDCCYNWNRTLGYGIKFDEIALPRAGVGNLFVSADRFYSKNQLYPWSILKLHGSLNWFHLIPIRKYPSFSDQELSLSDEQRKKVILSEGSWRFAEPLDIGGWYIDPVIITPINDKQSLLEENSEIFTPLWKKAEKELGSCKKLVIIGYFFPDTDKKVKDLFLKALSKINLDLLIIVNPDSDAIERAKSLFNYISLEVYSNLSEFIEKQYIQKEWEFIGDLPERYLKLGRLIIEFLSKTEFLIKGALWIYSHKRNEFELLLLTPLAADKNIRASIIDPLINTVSSNFNMPINQLLPLNPKDQLVQRLRKSIGPDISNRKDVGIISVSNGRVSRYFDVKFVYYIEDMDPKVIPKPLPI